MKKIFIVLIFVSILFITINTSANATGLFYTNAKYPVTATGITTGYELASLKQGRASALNVLYFVEIGDASAYEAARKGHISKVSFVDINEKTVFLFFRRITTIVYGE